jgi:hypothetical protein
MRGFWNEENWHLDGHALILPNGHRLTLATIRQRQLDAIEGRCDLPGKWSGWRIRQQWLIPPNGTMRHGRIAQHVLRHLMHTNEQAEHDGSRRQLDLF